VPGVRPTAAYLSRPPDEEDRFGELADVPPWRVQCGRTASYLMYRGHPDFLAAWSIETSASRSGVSPWGRAASRSGSLIDLGVFPGVRRGSCPWMPHQEEADRHP